MKLNRFLRPRSTRSHSIRAHQHIVNSAASARPTVEPLEERQLMSLTIEVRNDNGGTSAAVTSVGQVVDFEILAVVSGTTPGANDGFNSAAGSFLSTETSSANSVAGDLATEVALEYQANGAQNGNTTDLNGDGNLDVGSNNNGDIAGFFNARAGYDTQDGVVSGDTQTFTIGSGTYTVTNLHYGSATNINFRLRNGQADSAFDADWLEDGQADTDDNATVATAAPFVITDPNLSPPVNTTGSISGTVTKSANGSTSGFAGVTVYLKNSGTLDISTPTSSNGSYSFTGLPAGTYDVSETVPSGYSQTSPGSSPIVVGLAAGQNATGENFIDTANTVAPTTGSIAGTVSKVVSGVTSGFSGVTVSLTDSGGLDITTPTSSSGSYSFTGLPAGTYDVSESVPSGYNQTSPSTSQIAVALSSGENATGENFTDTAVASTGPKPLAGSVIGTAGSFQNDGNTLAKAFDGNLSTFYDGSSANGNWAGLNLGAEYTISSVSYSPRSGWAGRMVGGIFQGSNDPNFVSGVVNLATVSATPSTGVYTSLSVSSTSAFEYVRYLSPSGSYGDVAELEFFGTVSKSTGPNPLSGTIIGTAGSFQNDGNTIAKAFDGNLSTFFDAPIASGNWAGLNLGSTYDITKINYAPRSGWASRMVGGIFQGSNDPNFATGVINLATISSTPTTGSFTSISISNSGAFQYVRYLSPTGSYGDVAELQFFGTAATVTNPKLTGTVIGTSGSFQNDGNTIAKAFDGNLSTFFDGPVANGNWCGLDLGSAKTIAQISYTPRPGWAARMVGGIFQASNSANFSSGVVNLYTINATPAANAPTTVSVSENSTYRYVRYLSPNGSYGDVAEIAFYS